MAKRGVGEEDAPGRGLLERTGRMPVVRTRAGSPCHKIWPRPRVAGLSNGVGGIWLWMGGEKREYRIQKTEYRMWNDEVISFDFATLRSG
jgi:hypothetical protein